MRPSPRMTAIREGQLTQWRCPDNEDCEIAVKDAMDYALALRAERDQAIQGERDRACERDQARAAIAWAMGGNGSDFRARRDGEGGYWWRGELGQRAGMRWNGADCEWPPITTPVKPRCNCDADGSVAQDRADGFGVLHGAGCPAAAHPLEDLKEKQP